MVYMKLDDVTVASFDNGASFYVCQDNEVYRTEYLDKALEMAEVIAFNNHAAMWRE